MGKQTQLIEQVLCQRGTCDREATWGVYRWAVGASDVDLDRPVWVVCGRHKPQWKDTMQQHRNVRIATRVEELPE